MRYWDGFHIQAANGLILKRRRSYLDRREDGLMPATFCLGEESMGQSFESARVAIKDVSAMWPPKASRGGLRKENQI